MKATGGLESFYHVKVHFLLVCPKYGLQLFAFGSTKFGVSDHETQVAKVQIISIGFLSNNGIPDKLTGLIWQVRCNQKHHYRRFVTNSQNKCNGRFSV